ncbi:hypothetical protein L208DRAFT_415444 [Tricholoma matsutake]|nr:hypothetical protein L208DRAFT_415444 [Tricholoma matsutake 945]
MGGVDISNHVDGMFFGFIISVVLLGVTIVQGWVYLLENHDKWPIRTLVTVLILLDLAETCCGTQMLRHYLITRFGDVTMLNISTNTVAADFVITLTIMFLVHMFFITRIYILGRNPLLAASFFLLSVSVLVLGIWMFPKHFSHHRFSNFNQLESKIQIIAFHSVAAVTDISITIALSYTFSTGQKGYANTRMLFRRLLVYSLSRGIIISLLQVGHIIMYLVRPAQFLFWISLHFNLSKLYVTTTCMYFIRFMFFVLTSPCGVPVFILNSRFSPSEKANDAGPGSIRLTFASVESEGNITRNGTRDLSEVDKDAKVWDIVSLAEQVAV